MNQEGIFKDDEFLYAQKKSKVDISTLPNCPSDQSVLWTSCQGTYTFASGGIYVGEYKDNMMHGQGTFTYADGRKEVGAWENNNLNGYAVTYYADGSIDQEGIFKNDKLLYTEKRSKPIITPSTDSE